MQTSSMSHSQSSLSSSIVLQAQLERLLRRFHDSKNSPSDISDEVFEVSHEPGEYIAPDSRRSNIVASSDVKRDLTGSATKL